MIIKLNPVFKDTVWGGSRLKDDFSYSGANDSTGECWGIASHPNGTCVVADGDFAGMSLSELYSARRDLFGGCESDTFPLLTKILDAKEDLSIQVHPDDRYANENENGSLGKTECWYVIDAKEAATIVIGHNASAKEEMQSMINDGRWTDFIREVPVKKGDFFQINPGTLHAIKGGTLILETQQNSDVTYRVYDYDRLSDGQPRELHIDKSIDVMTVPFSNEGVAPVKTEVAPGVELLVECDYYKVWKACIDGDTELKLSEKFLLVSVIDGSGTFENESVKKGDHFIVTADFENIKMAGKMELILSAPR